MRNSQRSGMALALVMVVVVVAATMAGSFLASQGTAIEIARNVENHARARFIAESGLDLTIAYIRSNNGWRSEFSHGTWLTGITLDGGTYTVVGEDGLDEDGDGVVDGDGDLSNGETDALTLSVTGKYNGTSHLARAVIRPAPTSLEKLLYVVKDASKLSLDDDDRIALFKEWGYEVTTISDSASSSEFDSAGSDVDVAYISKDVKDNNVKTKLKDVLFGIVSEEVKLCDEFGVSKSGKKTKQTSIDIVDNTHEITSAFSVGLLTVLSQSSDLSRMESELASSASVLAEEPSKDYAMLVAIEAGKALNDGSFAAGRRVQMPWGDGGFEFSYVNDDGKTLMRRSIDWAAANVAVRQPIAHWYLNEISGVNAGDSISNHHGTFTNGVSLAETGIASSTGVRFDGSNDYVLVPHSDDLLIDNGTVSFWFNSESLSSHKALFSKDSSGCDTGGHIHIYTDGSRVKARLQNTKKSYTVQSSSDLSTNKWHHVAVTFGASGLKLYLDGFVVDTDSYSGGLGTSSGGVGNQEPLVFGAGTWSSGNLTHQSLNYYYRGLMDDIRIYDSSLSGAEIKSIYEAGSEEGEDADAQLIALYEFKQVQETADLVGHWKLDESAGGDPGIAVATKFEFGTGTIDSYDSSSGAYGGSNQGSSALVTVNATGHDSIEMYGGATLKGDAYVGPGGNAATDISLWSATITGITGELDSAVTMPSLSAPTGSPFSDASEGNLSLWGSLTDTINTDRHLTNLQLWGNSKMTVDGDVTVLLEGNLEVNSGAQLVITDGSTLNLYVKGGLGIGGKVNALGHDPGRLRLFMLGNSKVLELWGSAQVHAIAQNPQGKLEVWSGSQFFGTYMGTQVQGTGRIHVDRNYAAGLASSSAADEVAGNNGTYSNAPLCGVSGQDGTAVSFDGDDDYIEIPHSSSYLLNNGTVSLWFNTDSVSSRQGIFSKDSTGCDTGGHLTMYTESSKLKVRLQSTSKSKQVESGKLSNNTWYHVAFTFGAGGMKLYIDGTEVDSDSYSGGLGTNSGSTGNYEPIALGANSWGSGNLVVAPLQDYFSGSIDDVRMYDYPLSETQVKNLYNGQAIGDEGFPGLIIYDTSGFGAPVNLTINDVDAVTWIEGGGLTFDSSTKASSESAATKLHDALTATGEFTLEVKFQPANVVQDGPARIFSYSKNTSNRNFTFGQEDQRYIQRLRTTSVGNNGTPDIESGNVLSPTELQHVVVTHDGDILKMYRNGSKEVTSSRPGTYDWDKSYLLLMANEDTDNRAWLGTIYRIAIYDKALSNSQVNEIYGISGGETGENLGGLAVEWDEGP